MIHDDRFFSRDSKIPRGYLHLKGEAKRRFLGLRSDGWLAVAWFLVVVVLVVVVVSLSTVLAGIGLTKLAHGKPSCCV